MKRLLESSSPTVDRRAFIKVSALAGGGLLVGTYLRFGPAAAFAESLPAADNFTPNAFISITPTGAISIIAPNSEMGQGIKTSLPMIVAEELDVAWQQVTITQGDLNPAYGRQMCGSIALSMSASVGCGFFLSSAAAVMGRVYREEYMPVKAYTNVYFRPSSLPATRRSTDSRMRFSRVSGFFAMWIHTTKFRRSRRENA